MKNNLGKILIAAPVHSVLIEGLNAKGYECVVREKITQAEAFSLIKDCVGVVTSTRLLLDKELLDSAPLLRWIARMGSGMEIIDTQYAAQKDIACFSSPEGNRNAVGEHAVGMLLSLVHRIAWSYGEIKEGLWLREQNRGMELEGKTIGIIGYGNTGRAFEKKLRGFDMRVLAYDKYMQEGFPEHVTNCKDLTPIFEEADIVSFHVPLQADTVYYLNREFIGNMRKPFILINTSRGGVVDMKDLFQGLRAGKVRGACLDVLEQEPLAAMDADMRALLNEMQLLPQVIITPHIAGYTVESLYKMSNILLHKIFKKDDKINSTI